MNQLTIWHYMQTTFFQLGLKRYIKILFPQLDIYAQSLAPIPNRLKPFRPVCEKKCSLNSFRQGRTGPGPNREEPKKKGNKTKEQWAVYILRERREREAGVKTVKGSFSSAGVKASRYFILSFSFFFLESPNFPLAISIEIGHNAQR